MKSFILLIGIVIVVIIGFGLLSLVGTLTTEPVTTETQIGQTEPANSTLSMEQAKRIAQESECMNEGILSDTY
ncbi:MAG: hypothetical protein JXA43_01030, partial [Candidatus Diapherotrites archaeon]|nr:hypothetical protein [Candidatus Diapherotrites archaeon]